MSNDIEELSKLFDKFNKDENVKELKNYYNTSSIMEIFGIERDEKTHTSFLRWLFDNKLNDDLGTKPLKKFLELLKKDSKGKIIIESVEKEKDINPDGQLDLFIQYSIDNKKYAIVLENKVEAKESKKTNEKGKEIYQTERYYNHFEKKKEIKYIYVFLAPEYDDKKATAKDKHFINVSYKELADNVIFPLLNKNYKATPFLEDYLKTLRSTKRSKPKLVRIANCKCTDKEKKLIKIIDDTYKENGFYKLLKNYSNRDDKEEINSIVNNIYINNNEEIASIWPGLINTNNRHRVVTFEELNIPKGRKLFLTDKQMSNNPIGPEKYVKVIDDKTTVEYKKNGEVKQDKISNAAKELLGKDYGLRGINWFVINTKKGYKNLNKVLEELENK